jgi:hypothetical protein
MGVYALRLIMYRPLAHATQDIDLSLNQFDVTNDQSGLMLNYDMGYTGPLSYSSGE